MDVIGWLLEGDPAIRWQVLRDLANAPAGDVAAERGRVEHDGWGARLLALDYFRRSGPAPDPRMTEAAAVVRSKRQPGRWLLGRVHPGRVYFDLEEGVGTPSRRNTLRAPRMLAWWDGIA